MIKTTHKVLAFTFFFFLVGLTTAQTLSKKSLKERVVQLEQENSVLKKDMEILQRHVYRLLEQEKTKKTATNDTITALFFEVENYDFGKIVPDTIVNYSFEFVNEGTVPLLIKQVTASCGCTTPEWPKWPILPKQKAMIHVRFNSAGKSGKQYKVINIVANTFPSKTRIYIQADVQRGF